MAIEFIYKRNKNYLSKKRSLREEESLEHEEEFPT
jgi:hypothetical protein